MYLPPTQPTMQGTEKKSTSRRPSYPPNSRVFVGNLDNAHVTKEDLRKIFERYGPLVEDVRLHKGFAFIQYETTKQAHDAIAGENGRLLGTKRLDVSIARGTKSERREMARKRSRELFGEDLQDPRLSKRPATQPVDSFTYGQQPYAPTPYTQHIGLIPIYVIHTALKPYAEWIRSQFQQHSIPLVIQCVEKKNFDRTLDEALQRRQRYTIFVRRKNETEQTVGFRAILDDGSTPGIADIPIADAISYILKTEAARVPQNYQVNNMGVVSNNTVYNPSMIQPSLVSHPPPPDQGYPTSVPPQQGVHSNLVEQYTPNSTVSNTYQEHGTPIDQAQDTSTSPELLQNLINLINTLQDGTQQQQPTTTTTQQQYVPQTVSEPVQTTQDQQPEEVQQNLLNLLSTLQNITDNSEQSNLSTTNNQQQQQQYQY